MWLTQAHFGMVGAPLPVSVVDLDPDPDDELLDVTPPDVVMALGFDPLIYADATEGDGIGNDASAKVGAWEYFDHDNAQYRRPTTDGGPLAPGGMTDVLAGGKWVAYRGADRTAPHIYGDPIADPLASGKNAA